MCVMTVRDDGSEIPESHCSECDMRFNICWNANPVFDAPRHCPFCGDEIKGWVRVAEAQEPAPEVDSAPDSNSVV